ncbi:MAG: penicillin-binding protein 2 [Melioribacteraceae bacterium]|nr:penicillin-binding protein 2 [Melioribacteraceae bacterium]MCF8265057.1 penicillin-binding protein 2 [Melioribacteraceae bacterium]MCF8412456.1 penicillin-binding protein 2 [Melioribacteraceae bacterium]MCF8431914.1 penicillin-binding protein 2 [Melioribacteraceae bacterium]
MNDVFFGSLTRRKILFTIIIIFYGLISFNLFKMQILDTFLYEEKSDENSVKKIVKSAPRGIFYDRNYNVLVSNKPSFELSVIPADYDTSNNKLIENLLGVDPGYISQIMYENRRFSKYVPLVIHRNAGFKLVSWLEENSSFLPGVNYEVSVQRDYSFGVNGAHMFGYIKEISQSEYRKYRDIYGMGDFIGNNGLERSYERYLRGDKGYNYIIVDSKQKFIAEYTGEKNRDPIKGDDLVLSIDADVQMKAEELFRDKTGAVVAINPQNGEVLAFVSSPSFDLSNFSSITSNDVWSNLLADTSKPMFNRVTNSIYPPGSTIKMLMALIGLEEGILTKSTTVNCQGGYKFGNRFFQCLHKHGTVNVEKAIEKSCNTFFYKLALDIGLDNIVKYGRRFGFGMKTGLDIGEESSGLLPDENYYNKIYGKKGWTRGILLNIGIGQGELSATPMQLARYAALFANWGKSKRPHFVKGTIDSETFDFTEFEYESIDVGIQRENFDIIREAMRKVVNGQGTATWIRLPDIVISGKTGTSQNPFGEDHALFVGFAPFDNPQIALAVVVENVGHGGTHAAPIARDLIKTFLRKENKITKFSEEMEVVQLEN